MENLIPVINKLQDIFNTVGGEAIDIPQIVVVGSQSAGKSSVIESIVGRTFLPRGTGIVTRCPLILQLINCPKTDLNHRSPDDGTETLEEWGKFLHTGDQIFTEFDDIRQEIEDQTERIAGSNKGICPEPINLKIYSTRVINLTLVDLPGITKVPIGDQPEDIEIQVKELILKFIQNPNSIILAVTPGNVDLATSEAIQMAMKQDPEGDRTLAVITKLDLMDKGTDAMDILNGNVIPVKLGIIGVVNRSQQNIIDKKGIKAQLKDEAAFLQRKYAKIAEQNGTPYLAKRLNCILMHHIRDCLPGLEKRVNTEASKFRKAVYSLGKEVTDKNQVLMHLISKFASAYCSAVEGSARRIRRRDLSGGARMCYIFHETFATAMASIDPLQDLSDLEIADVIRHSNGPRPALFVPELAFELLVQQQIKLFEEPAYQCVELIFEEMLKIIHDCGNDIRQELLRFPKANMKIVEVVTNLLRQQLPEMNAKVEFLIKMELAYINTKHPDFRKDPQPHEIPKLDEDAVRKLTEKEKKDCILMKHCITNYFNIIRKSIQDSVPKTIMLCLVNFITEKLHTELLTTLYKPELAEQLILESENIAVERKKARDMLAALTRANEIITEIRDM